MIRPCPKPAPSVPALRKPIKRSRVRTRRSKARRGRLKGAEMSELRTTSWQYRRGICIYCKLPCGEWFGELAHIRGKRSWGDNLGNVSPAHRECHQKFHAYGPSLEKPCKKKERAA
jgi:hypothetical protein